MLNKQITGSVLVLNKCSKHVQKQKISVTSLKNSTHASAAPVRFSNCGRCAGLGGLMVKSFCLVENAERIVVFLCPVSLSPERL